MDELENTESIGFVISVFSIACFTMTTEEIRIGPIGEEGGKDRFPFGMRVLAVDDDPICLTVLDNLLRKCHYQGLSFFFF